MENRSLKISLVIIGISGMTAQIVLLREFLIAFFGNELTLGILLANWLMLETIGSFFIGKTVEKTGKKMEIYVLFQIVLSIALPFAIYLARIFKNILLTTPGEGLGFASIGCASFFILLPVTLPHGGLFTYGCKLYSQSFREEASSIGKVYVLGTIGSMIGGLLTTFVLIRYLNSFEIAFAISFINTLIAPFLLWPKHPISFFNLRNDLWALSILLTFFFAFLFTTPLPKAIHQSSIRAQWKEANVIHNENSIYGNITVTRRGEQYTFFTNGIPSVTTPVDIASMEDSVHFPMLFHKKPESILILSGGAGGMIHEILKYSVTSVDYVELDPLLLKLIQQFPTSLTQSELSDKKVKIHYTDGRFFVKRTQDRFDVIFIGLPLPLELQTNRLFTSEFFSDAKRKMRSDGIIVLTLPGSLTYISPELRELNTCILETLKNVYRSVRIIPGDTNLYLASDSEEMDHVTAEELIKRLQERKIKTSLFTQSYIDYRLNDRWLNWFLKSMEGKRININSDFRPLGLFFSLSYWNALFSPYLTGIFKEFEKFSLKITIVLIMFLTLILAALWMKEPHLSRYSVPYAIFTTGFTGMIFNLAVIFTFQTLYGYLYHQIGLIVTIFMGGIAFGSLFITWRLDKIRNDPNLFLATELLTILFSFLLPFVLSNLSIHLEQPAIYVLLYGAFMIMSFFSGLLLGLQFPLASKIYLGTLSREGGFGQTAGLLYGADLLGGFFGGLFGGVLLLPILGLKESCFMMAMIKGSSFLLFLLFTRVRK